MNGTCDGCGKQSELHEHIQKWFGGEDRTSHLCADCLVSIRKKRNKNHDALIMSKPPDVAPVEPLCGTKPFLSEDEHKRQIEKYADHRPSISVSLDGRERIHAEGKSPARPPSAASLAKKMRFLVEEDKSRGQHEK